MNLERYRLYARMPVYLRRLELARETIRHGLAACARPYVACSFGKDSAALLHLVMTVRPDIQARFVRWPETELLGDYERVIEEWLARGADIQILDLRRDSSHDAVPERWVQLREMAPADGYFIGLRAEESRARKLTLRSHGVIYQLRDGYTRISPLAWWSTDDVATYILQHQLPTLVNYQFEGFDARTSSRVPRAQFNIRETALSNLRRRDPAAWGDLMRLYPELLNPA